MEAKHSTPPILQLPAGELARLPTLEILRRAHAKQAIRAVFGNEDARRDYETLTSTDFTTEKSAHCLEHLRSFYRTLIAKPRDYIISADNQYPSTKLDRQQRGFLSCMIAVGTGMDFQIQGSFLRNLVTWEDAKYQADPEGKPSTVKLKMSHASLEDIINLEFDLTQPNAVGQLARDTFRRCMLDMLYWTTAEDSLYHLGITIPEEVIQRQLLPKVNLSKDPWEAIDNNLKPRLADLQKLVIIAEEQQKTPDEINAVANIFIASGARLSDNFLRHNGLLASNQKILDAAGTNSGQLSSGSLPKAPSRIELAANLLRKCEKFNKLAPKVQQRLIKILAKVNLELLTETKLAELFVDTDPSATAERVSNFMRGLSTIKPLSVPAQLPASGIQSLQTPTPSACTPAIQTLEFDFSIIQGAFKDLPKEQQTAVQHYLEKRRHRTVSQFLNSQRIKPITDSEGFFEYRRRDLRLYFKVDNKNQRIIFQKIGKKSGQIGDISDLK